MDFKSKPFASSVSIYSSITASILLSSCSVLPHQKPMLSKNCIAISLVISQLKFKFILLNTSSHFLFFISIDGTIFILAAGFVAIFFDAGFVIGFLLAGIILSGHCVVFRILFAFFGSRTNGNTCSSSSPGTMIFLSAYPPCRSRLCLNSRLDPFTSPCTTMIFAPSPSLSAPSHARRSSASPCPERKLNCFIRAFTSYCFFSVLHSILTRFCCPPG